MRFKGGIDRARYGVAIGSSVGMAPQQSSEDVGIDENSKRHIQLFKFNLKFNFNCSGEKLPCENWLPKSPTETTMEVTQCVEK